MERGHAQSCNKYCTFYKQGGEFVAISSTSSSDCWRVIKQVYVPAVLDPRHFRKLVMTKVDASPPEGGVTEILENFTPLEPVDYACMARRRRKKIKFNVEEKALHNMEMVRGRISELQGKLGERKEST